MSIDYTTKQLLSELQAAEQREMNFRHLAHALLGDPEINERASDARRVLGPEPGLWSELAEAFLTDGLPFELRELDGVMQVSAIKLRDVFWTFIPRLLVSLSTVRPKNVPLVAVDDGGVDALDTGLGVLAGDADEDHLPPELRGPEVVLTPELTRRVRNDVEAALRMIAVATPTETAIQLLTALLMELSGHMKRPRSSNLDDARIERVRKALRRSRKQA